MVIHFKSDVFTAVAVMNAKLPSTLSNLKICFLLICFHQMLPCKSFWYNKKIKKIILDHSCKHQPLCISAFQLRPFENLKMSKFPSPPPPPPRFMGQSVDRCITTSTPSSSYDSLAFLSFIFFLPFLSFAQALP